MKKILLLAFLMSITSSFVSAQFTFRRISSPVVTGDTSTITPTVTKGVMQNTSAGAIEFKYVRILNNLPASDWICQMCGGGLCFGPETDSLPPYPFTPIILAPGQTDTLAIDITGRTPGTATIIMKAYLFSNPSFSITDTFKVTLRPPNSITPGTEFITGYKLNQNYPNPFNPSTNIRYELPKSGFVRLVVYDILGKEIETLVSKKQNAGTYEATFSASQITSEVYFCRLTIDGYSETRKMLLIR